MSVKCGEFSTSFSRRFQDVLEKREMNSVAQFVVSTEFAHIMSLTHKEEDEEEERQMVLEVSLRA
jgi:hypothetical protein